MLTRKRPFPAVLIAAITWILFSCHETPPPTPQAGFSKSTKEKSSHGSSSSDSTVNAIDGGQGMNPQGGPILKDGESLGTSTPGVVVPVARSQSEPQPSNENGNGSGPSKEMSEQAPAPSPAPPATPPPPTIPVTHRVSVTCTNGLSLSFAHSSMTTVLSVAAGQINGEPTEIQTQYCPQIRTVLDQKGLPTGKTTAKATGSQYLSAKCTGTVLELRYISGDPVNGTGISTVQSKDIFSAEVCLEVRNIINGLNLQPKAN